MSEASPIYTARSFVVTTDDGTVFSCVAMERRRIGLVPASRFWSLVDMAGAYHIGPCYVEMDDAGDVQRRVSAWWTRQRAAGLAAHRDANSPTYDAPTRERVARIS
jgi:hypothetical protein